jgi:ketosteroid isomerase-like protein
MTSDGVAMRTIIESWAKAVREKDIEGILANHTDDIVLFDVPLPFRSSGIVAYRETWTTFYDWAKDSGVFDIEDLVVIDSSDVAFCYATMRCSGYTDAGDPESLQFRLTIGLEKVDGTWMIRHEHHSVPSTA